MQFERILKAEQERYRVYNDLAIFLGGVAKEPFYATISIIDMLDDLSKDI